MRASNTGPCQHWTPAAGECGDPNGSRYLTGLMCPKHTPAALAGRPETVPDPTLTLEALRKRAGIPIIATAPASPTAIDRQAIASGKRRSSPDAYRQAQAGR